MYNHINELENFNQSYSPLEKEVGEFRKRGALGFPIFLTGFALELYGFILAGSAAMNGDRDTLSNSGLVLLGGLGLGGTGLYLMESGARKGD